MSDGQRNIIERKLHGPFTYWERGIDNYEELKALTEKLSGRFNELSDEMRKSEKRMVEIGALLTHINNYSRTRKVYEAYRKSGYSRKFFEEHREEIQIHKAAKQAFEQLPERKVPSRKSLNEEFHRCLSEKKKAYTEYRQVKKRCRNTWRQNRLWSISLASNKKKNRI